MPATQAVTQHDSFWCALEVVLVEVKLGTRFVTVVRPYWQLSHIFLVLIISLDFFSSLGFVLMVAFVTLSATGLG